MAFEMTARRLPALLWLALGAASGCFGSGDQCKVGETRCLNNEAQVCDMCDAFGCSAKWFPLDPCGSRTCLALPGQRAMCVERADPDPLCPPAGLPTVCEGNAVVSCSLGYRTGTAACGSALGSAPDETLCVARFPGVAACVSPAAMSDPACGGGSGPRCVGTTLVECIAGLAVDRTACASCATSAPAGDLGSVGFCTGALGAPCGGSGDCASGLTCRPDSQGASRCTVGCTDGAPLPPADGGAAVPSAACLDVFRAGGPPPSSYLEAVGPGSVLACVGGYCEWTD